MKPPTTWFKPMMAMLLLSLLHQEGWHHCDTSSAHNASCHSAHVALVDPSVLPQTPNQATTDAHKQLN